jgi:hypothetical protein
MRTDINVFPIYSRIGSEVEPDQLQLFAFTATGSKLPHYGEGMGIERNRRIKMCHLTQSLSLARVYHHIS